MRKIASIIAVAGMVLFFSSCDRDRGPYPAVQRSFVEEFYDNRMGWEFADPANNAYGEVNNGIYMFDYNDDFTEAYYVSKLIGFNRYSDFTIYTRIRSNNNMGLLFGDNSSVGSYGYSFTIDYDGYYALYDEGGNGYGPDVQTIVAPTTNNRVVPNGGWNDLRLEQRGDRWIGFVNDVQVFNVPAQNLLGTNVGFVDVKNTQGDADYLQVDWWE
ncbi:family 16 glycoside hydrolase [Taibaiella helva]|uniref:family 16 glycoside hydrolase n=1 Tax=Taibaiella helva TaxID=2301235 RepID=UPI000E56BDE1|nr:family 16 glycoside hydrolase [Taibaiella helva]